VFYVSGNFYKNNICLLGNWTGLLLKIVVPPTLLHWQNCLFKLWGVHKYICVVDTLVLLNLMKWP